MMCRNPYATSDGKAYGCGQCMPCRFNRRRKWQARIMLEALQYTDNTFVTLTYDEKHLPKTDSGVPTLLPKDLRNFFDRLRFHYGTVGHRGLRYYAVGEYGDETFRPHYHVALFNHPNCAYGMSVYSKLRVRCCPVCELVRKIWGKGHVYLGTLERNSAGYVASYVTKKMTKKDDERLGDRYPEFARMSLRPGIGADAMWEVADVLLKHGLDSLVDVPKKLNQSRKGYPLDRYLVKKLRSYVGKDEKAPQEVIDEIAEELSSVYARAKNLTSAPGMRQAFRYVFADLVEQEGEAEYKRWLHRQRMFNRKRNVL